jgi:pimeloyl-ACP methyl ester carboxylesterase
MVQRTSACLALLLGIASCQSTTAFEDANASSHASSRDPIAFTPCALVSHPPSSDASADCAAVDVPLDWDNSAGRRASFFVKRLRGGAPGLHKQVWLLNGGPGGAGDGLEGLAKELGAGDSTLDVYIPDHRGTGRSTFFDCPEAFAAGFDRAACAAELKRIWGDDGLRTFSTTTAARDVGSFIERTREEGQEVHVYGFSYGTYWAQRYLQLFPSQPTAVTLDGIVQSGLVSAHEFDHQVDRVGKKFLADCAADSICGQKLGPDPVAKVRAAIAVADSGGCPGLEGIDGSLLRIILRAFVPNESVRLLVPAVAYRTLRCNDNDIVVLKNLIAYLIGAWGSDGTGAPPPRYFSDALNHHIVFSEMQKLPVPSRQEVEALMADAIFGEYSPLIADAYDAWPRYSRDPWVGRYPETKVPVLLLNGTLDTQTPIEFAEEVARHYTAPSQRFVAIPRAAHGTVLGASSGPATSCGRILWTQFLANPTGELDTSCTVVTAPFDFETSAAGTKLFGTANLFEGVAEPRPPNPQRRPDPVIARVFAEIREKSAARL